MSELMIGYYVDYDCHGVARVLARDEGNEYVRVSFPYIRSNNYQVLIRSIEKKGNLRYQPMNSRHDR